MKKKNTVSLPPGRPPTEDEIRDYAYHLYLQSGCIPGRDVDNWLEAKACLEANIPRHHAHARLHRHRHPAPRESVTVITLEAQGEPGVDPFEALPSEDVYVEGVVVLATPKP